MFWFMDLIRFCKSSILDLSSGSISRVSFSIAWCVGSREIILFVAAMDFVVGTTDLLLFGAVDLLVFGVVGLLLFGAVDLLVGAMDLLLFDTVDGLEDFLIVCRVDLYVM
jgi:hypothetical protein